MLAKKNAGKIEYIKETLIMTYYIYICFCDYIPVYIKLNPTLVYSKALLMA